jgi:acyl dehydratase
MKKQIYWEDVRENTDLPTLVKIATTRTLVKWAGASGDFHPQHYDFPFCEAYGIGTPILHGMLKAGWLTSLVTSWMGEEGTLKKFAVRHTAMDHPRSMKSLREPRDGETWQCKGKVTKKYTLDGEFYVDCELELVNGKGEVTCPGTATVTLPSRS